MLRYTLLLLVATAAAHGAPCVMGSLDDYFGLGATGCELGMRTLSNFMPDALTAGSAEISPGSVQVTPSVMGPEESLLFTFNQVASVPDILESIFTFQVDTGTSAPQRIRLELLGAAATGSGAVIGITDLGAAGSLLPVVLEGFADPDVAGVFSPGPSFVVLQDFILDSGDPFGSGTASLEAARLTFQTVPEPGTAALLVCGGIAVFALGRRARRARTY